MSDDAGSENRESIAVSPSRLEAIASGVCDHENPVCICNTSDSKRADLLEEYLDDIAEGGWSGVQLMPLDKEGKRPIIAGRCRLGSDEAKSLLVDPDEAISKLRRGTERGFCLYAGKPEHGTRELVFTDHDDPDRFPADSETLTVVSGSGTGYHQTFENSESIQNAKGKDDLNRAGEVRAQNLFVVTPGSIHPSGGIYWTCSYPGIATLTSDDLPQELLPRDRVSSQTKSDPDPLDTDVPDSLADIDAEFDVETRYRVMLKCSESATIKSVIRGNLSESRFKDDRHQAEGYLAEQIGFYMDRDREVIRQVLQALFRRNPETDAHQNLPAKRSNRKFLHNEQHRTQILDYGASPDSSYTPGSDIRRHSAEERPEVGAPLFERVHDALSDLVLARTVEIVEHDRVDRGKSQVRRALRKMREDEDFPYDVERIKEGRKQFYYLPDHRLLIDEDRREELGI